MLLEKKDAFVTKETAGIGNRNEIALETIRKTTSLVADDALNSHTRHHEYGEARKFPDFGYLAQELWKGKEMEASA